MFFDSCLFCSCFVCLQVFMTYVYVGHRIYINISVRWCAPCDIYVQSPKHLYTCRYILLSIREVHQNSPKRSSKYVRQHREYDLRGGAGGRAAWRQKGDDGIQCLCECIKKRDRWLVVSVRHVQVKQADRGYKGHKKIERRFITRCFKGC